MEFVIMEKLVPAMTALLVNVQPEKPEQHINLKRMQPVIIIPTALQELKPVLTDIGISQFIL